MNTQAIFEKRQVAAAVLEMTSQWTSFQCRSGVVVFQYGAFLMELCMKLDDKCILQHLL